MNREYTYRELKDSELILLFRQDNKLAFQELYKRYSSKIYVQIKRHTKCTDTAKDILQLLFIKVWQNRDSIDVNRPIAPFLYRIAANMVIDYFRKVSRDQNLKSSLLYTMEEEYDHIEPKIFKEETEELLQKAIKQLPPKRAQIYQLCKIEGYSYQQVSQILGISIATINDHLVKANKSVRKYIRI